MFCSAGCSLLRAGGFSCNLDVLNGDLGISKLQFMIKKYQTFFQLEIFINFGHKNPEYGLDPYPDGYSA